MDKIIHSSGSLVLLFAASGLLSWLVYGLFGLYQESPRAKSRWLTALELDPEQLGGFSYSHLALISVLSLFLEVMTIRWISSEIRVFAYFKNLVLVACFLGFGLGCYFCRRRVQLTALIAPLLVLTVLLKTPLSPLHQVLAALPQMLGGGTEVNTWGVPSSADELARHAAGAGGHGSAVCRYRNDLCSDRTISGLVSGKSLPTE